MEFLKYAPSICFFIAGMAFFHSQRISLGLVYLSLAWLYFILGLTGTFG